MANVDYVVPELTAMTKQYQTITDCISGSEAIKKAGVKYLPDPNAHTPSPENTAKYNNYRDRALFFNATRRTLNGLTGQIYSRDPEIVLPGLLSPLLMDANGVGIGLTQLSKQVTRKVLSHGRAGLHTDYPNFPNGPSREDINRGLARPTINY